MKRKTAWFLICIWMILALCGCGAKKKDYDKLLSKKSPVTITIWHYYNGVQQVQFDEMVAEFNNTVGSDRGIIVEAYSKNSVGELADNIIACVNKDPGAEKAPDIFATYAETAYQVDKQGMLVDLSKYLSQKEIEEYVEEYIEEGSLGKEGTLKIFPTAKSTEIMMLNLTDWQKFADASGTQLTELSTWEGLCSVAERYYQYTDALTPDVPNDGKAFFGRDSVANYVIVGAKQLGCEIASVAKDGSVRVSLDKQAVRRLWDNYYVPFVKGYYTAQSRFRTDDAKIGAIIALVGSTSGAAYYPSEVTIGDEYSYPIENVVLPVPNFAGCENYLVQQGAGMAVIRSDEKTEYACTVFLKWFTQAERNIRFSVNSGYLPVKKEANDFDAISASDGAGNIGSTMMATLKTAIDEINSYTLYTSPPYDQSAAVRDYLGNTLEGSAKQDQKAAQDRILAGEDRGAVLAEYTGDQAFDAWFAQLEAGFYEIVGEGIAQ